MRAESSSASECENEVSSATRTLLRPAILTASCAEVRTSKPESRPCTSTPSFRAAAIAERADCLMPMASESRITRDVMGLDYFRFVTQFFDKRRHIRHPYAGSARSLMVQLSPLLRALRQLPQTSANRSRNAQTAQTLALMSGKFLPSGNSI